MFLICGLSLPATTQCLPPVFTAATPTACSINLSWTADTTALSYTIGYRKGSGAWNYVSTDNEGWYMLENLDPKSRYTLRIQAVYSGCMSPFTAPLARRTLACAPPAAPFMDSITYHTARLSWNSVCGASSYDLLWRRQGDTVWQTLSGIEDTTFVLEGLPANREYEARIQIQCGVWPTPPSPLSAFSTLAYPDDGRPNILLIVTDDSRYDEYRVNGGPEFLELPAIERLSNEGVNFQIAAVPTPVCSPGRATIYTGLYPHRHGVLTNAQELDTALPTLQTILQAQGYYTAFVGKYGTGFTFPSGFNNWAVSRTLKYVNPPYTMNGVDTLFTGNLLSVYPQLCIDFLEEAPEDQPFLLMLFHRAPHDSITPLPEHEALYSEVSIPFPDNFESYSPPYPNYYDFYQLRWNQDSLETIEHKRQKYRALAGVDAAVQQLLDWLEYRDLLDRTLIIYTSDNGFMEGEHLLDNKGMALKESLQVPLFVRWPSWFTPAVVSNQIASIVDIAPTVLAAAGVPDTFNMQGLNLADLADGVTSRTSFLHMQTGTAFLPDIRSVRTLEGLYTFHSCDESVEEFFDLMVDPDENVNLIQETAYAGQIQEYRDLLDSLRTALGDTIMLTVKDCFLTTPEARLAEPQTLTDILVFPNPSNVYLDVLFPTGTQEGVLYFLDLEGRVLFEAPRHESSLSVLRLPVEHLAAGTYTLHYVQASGAINKLVQIIK